MTITVSDLKDYLRISHNDDDTFLATLLETAKALAYEKTGISYVSGDLLYEQLLKYLVQHFYDDRTAFADKQTVEVPYTLTTLIKHITYRGEFEPPEQADEQQAEQTE